MLLVTQSLVILAILPTIFIESATIKATCEYYYDSKSIYGCRLYVSSPVTATDVLEITGTHLYNHTDADVEAVSQVTNVVEFFNGEVLRKFDNLKSIVMLGGQLMEINANAFDICPNLRELRLNSNQLRTFPPGMLKNCKNLTSFGVINLLVQSVPEDLFGMTSNLESFTLSGNLTSLPEKLFQNMKKLNYVYISSNQLRELSPNFLINAPDIEEFIATGNKFQHQNDISYALNGRTNLKVLWLSNNNFSNFDFRFFTQFQKLTQLFIGSTAGPILSDISWQSLPSSLKSLFVDGIGENIPENSFSRLGGLEILSIHGYGIENLHKDTFKPLNKLIKLFIEGTRVNSLPSDLLNNQINLIQLTIKGSNIYRLNINSFGNHPYLRVINFPFNEINEIQRGIFGKFHANLTSVNLWSNVCISQYLYGENLDQHESLSSCFNNWDIMPDRPPVLTTTTPAGCRRSFRDFDAFAGIFVGLLVILII